MRSIADSSWKLTIKRNTDSICILRAAACGSTAVLPDIIEGLPVIEICDRAFSPDAAPVYGETVIIGNHHGEFNNSELVDLTLPFSLRSVGRYAFYNCRMLKTLRLGSSISQWGSGSLMNCTSLDTFHIYQDSPYDASLPFFAAVLPRELDVFLYRNAELMMHLTFPEYVEVYEENSPAHHFDLTISGAGYPYHSVFKGSTLSAVDYDSLWHRFLSVDHDNNTALRLAWNRLRTPFELSGSARAAYETYIQTNFVPAVQLVLNSYDIDGLKLLLSFSEINEEELTCAAELSRSLHFTEASALLLNKKNSLFPAIRSGRRYEL